MNSDTTVADLDHWPRRSSRLRTQLLLLVLLLMVPTLGLILWGNLEQRRLAREAVRERAQAISAFAALHEEHFVKNARQLLSTLAEFPFLVRATDRAFAQVHFQNLRKLSPDYLNFGLIELDGTVFASALPTNKPPRLGDRSYVRRVLESRRFAVGDFQIGRLSGEPSLNFGYPVFDGNNVTRVLYASLRLSLLSEPLARVPLPAGGVIVLFDSSGNILARHPDPETWVGQAAADTALVRWIQEHHRGTVELSGLDGITRLYAVTMSGERAAPHLFVAVGFPLDAAYASAQRDLLLNSVLTVLVASLVFAIAALSAKRLILRPVDALVTAAHRLTNGELKARAGISGASVELFRLGHAFNRMAQTLEKRQVEVELAQAEIQKINSELEARVQTRTAELAAVNAELEAFSYSVSHDLTTPLRHIDGFLGCLRRHAEPTLDKESQEYLARIGQAAAAMRRLIDDLLALARTTRTQMRSSPVDLNALVENVRAGLREDTKDRQITWKTESLPAVLGDASLLRQVLVNLLGNAVKYTRDRNPAVIEIGCSSQDSRQATVYVRDNGVGFDMKYAGKLFGAFQRLHPAEQFEGTGVGLANARRIIHRHRGKIWAEANLERGATFFFTLPVPSHGSS